MGQAGAARLVAENPAKMHEMANQFAKQHQFIPSVTTSSPQIIQDSYEKNNTHEKYPVTHEPLEKVKNQGAKNGLHVSENIGNSAYNQFNPVRQSVQKEISSQQLEMNNKRDALEQEGGGIETAVSNEQGRSVVASIGRRGASEVKKMVNDIPWPGKE